jgi:hypothetical protein
MFGIKIALYSICIFANIFLLGAHEQLQIESLKILAYMNMTLIAIGIIGDLNKLRKNNDK